MRNEIFFEGEYYHVYHRGVDQRMIFLDDEDRERFYWMLYLLNDWNFDAKQSDWMDRLSRICVQENIPEIDRRKRMVDIIAFILLGNHFHLLLRARADDAISKFMHRLQVSHSKFFNKKWGRSGSLMDERFGAVTIKSDAQLIHTPIYIHLNGLDLFGVPWRDGLVENKERIGDLLDDHQWSSHGVYLGRGQKLPVIDVASVRELFPTPDSYKEELFGWTGRYVV